MAKTVFRCQLCMSVAATLELAGAPEALSGELIISGFLWDSNKETIKGQAIRSLHQALLAHDAHRVHALNPLWAPFYCPQCQRVYCVKHWHITPHFDSDLAGQYASSHGTCPKGHRRMLDD